MTSDEQIRAATARERWLIRRFALKPNNRLLARAARIMADGQRFLMIQTVEPEQPPTQINVVLNWTKAVTSGK